MHDLAAKWDDEHGITKAVAKKMSDSGKPPKNRPCDWCGKVVREGWIHDKCADKERTFWLDLIY